MLRWLLWEGEGGENNKYDNNNNDDNDNDCIDDLLQTRGREKAVGGLRQETPA